MTPRDLPSVRGTTILAAALLLPSIPALGDVFHLRDGTSVEGQELRDLEDRLEIRTREGRRILAKSDIRRRESGRTPWETFEMELALADAEDARALVRLAHWARERGLEAEARRAWRRALVADPDHAEARLALGHSRVDGRWVAPAGEATPPEETGQPVPRSEPSPRETTLGLALEKRRSTHFQVEAADLEQAALGRYLDTFEKVREGILEFSGEAAPVSGGNLILVLLPDTRRYEEALDRLVRPALVATRPEREVEARMALYRKSRVAPLADGDGTVAVAAPVGPGETENRAYLAHFVAHETFRAITSPGVHVPDWIGEAVVYFVVNGMFPDDPAHCLAPEGYGRGGGPGRSWRNTRTWDGLARELVAGNRHQEVAVLTGLRLNELGFDALVQSWSLLDTLHRRDDAAARQFLRRLRRGSPFAEALKEAFRLDAPGLDRLWRAEMTRKRKP